MFLCALCVFHSPLQMYHLLYTKDITTKIYMKQYSVFQNLFDSIYASHSTFGMKSTSVSC